MKEFITKKRQNKPEEYVTEITTEETKIQELKNGKGAGPGSILAELNKHVIAKNFKSTRNPHPHIQQMSD